MFLSRCGGEVLKEKGDEQMPLITFCVRALKKSGCQASGWVKPLMHNMGLLKSGQLDLTLMTSCVCGHML